MCNQPKTSWKFLAPYSWFVSIAIVSLITSMGGCDWGSKEKQVSGTSNPGGNGEQKADGGESAAKPAQTPAEKNPANADEKTSNSRKITTDNSGDASLDTPKDAVPAMADSEELQKKAKQLVFSCIEQYQSLRSYEDSAVFRLKVPYPAKSIDEQIPCRIALERPNKLGLVVDLLKSSWTPETFESIYEDGNSVRYSNQRLVRPLPEMLSIDWLLRDHLDQQLLNPVFGLPLNIGFLLDAAGSKTFVDQASTRWLSPADIEGVKCERIQLTVKDLSWVYWIDEPNRRLLRQEFPHALLGGILPPIPSTVAPSDIICQVDFQGVKTNEQIDWTPWAIKPRETDLQVRRFIPTPARDIYRQLGMVVESFSLKDVDENVFFDFAERKSKVTSFHFVDDTESSRSYIDELFVVRRQLKDRGVGDEYETILVTNKPAKRMAAVMASWNCTLPLAIDSDGQLMAKWGIKDTPATVVVGKDRRIHHFSEKRMPIGMVSDVPKLINDVNIATDVIQTVVDDEARYSSLLHRFALSRDELKKLGADYQEIAQFPFSFHDVVPEWKVPFQDGMVAAVGEAFPLGLEKSIVDPNQLNDVGFPSIRVMTVLDDVGNLWSIDQRGNKRIVATLPVENTENAKRFWIYPDPWKHETIYIVPEGLSRYWFAVAPKTVATNWTPLKVDEFRLPKDETIVNASWVLADDEPAFCLVTNLSRLIALNPTTQESSVRIDSSKQNVAISSLIPKLNKKGLPEAWGVVRADGSIEYVESKVSRNELGNPKPLMFKPEVGPWLWGSSPDGPRLVGLSRIPSAETAAVVLDENYQSLSTQSLATRPEQCRLLSSATTKNGAFYFLFTAPNRVLHLQTIGGKAPDQMSFGRRIFGGAILPLEDGLRIVVAMEGEVSSWKAIYKD